MNVLETDHWCLLIPPEWWAEHDDDLVRIADRDGVGEIELTTLCREEGVVTAAEIEQLAREESPEVETWSSVRVGAFSGQCGAFAEDDAQLREWYVSAGPVLLYITYACDLENAGMDDAAVDEILATLVAADTEAS